MDQWFFQWSHLGVKGLALYLTGHYDAAAQAYRAHWRWAIANGVTTHDQGTNLLLSGDLEGVERYAREQTSPHPLCLLAHVHRLERYPEAIAADEAELGVRPNSPEIRRRVRVFREHLASTKRAG